MNSRTKALTQLIAAAVRGGAVNTTLFAAGLCLVSFSEVFAAQNSRLNLNISIRTIALITDLTAQPGSLPGSINLTWTEPSRNGTVAPHVYEVRASTAAQISDNAEFSSATVLSSLSGSPIPAPGPGGGQAGFVVTGLSPGVNYYFALRERDSGVALGAWVRNLPRGWNTNNSAIATPEFNAPNAITDLAAVPGSAEGDIRLSWTAPFNPNGVTISRYALSYATFSVAALSYDTTSWFNLAPSSVTINLAHVPGSRETFNIGGLHPAATYYFAVKSVDSSGQVSPVDARAATAQAQTRPRNLPPATPSGLAAIAGTLRAILSWNDLSVAEKGLDFSYFRLYRSTQPAADFVPIISTASLSFTDRPLGAFTTYYYRLSAVDGESLESALSAAVSVIPFGQAPMEPFGVRVAPSSDTVAISWSATTHLVDGTAFVDPASPISSELLGYRIYRSTQICNPNFVHLTNLPVAVTSFTDTTAGSHYYYRLKSYNSSGPSTSTLILSSLGEQHIFMEDCATRMVLDRAQAESLSRLSNNLGGDILIAPIHHPEDSGGNVMQSVEFKPMLDGVKEMSGFYLPTPARVVLRFETAGGKPVPQTTAMKAKGPASSKAGVTDSESAKNLGMYWNNGAEFKKMYGKVDPAEQTVTVASPNFGRYQIRSLLRSAGAVFDISNISSRVITPNDDGLNDILIFTYDPGPNSVTPQGKIYDMKGALVSDMTAGLVPNTLTWDGKMGGRAVTGGVYVYQIEGDRKIFNGTVVIAR